MRKVILILFLLLYCCPAWATWTIGNHSHAFGSLPSLMLTTTGNTAVLVSSIHGSNCTATPHDSLNVDSIWALVDTQTTTVNNWQSDLYIASGPLLMTGANVAFTTIGTCATSTIFVFGLNNATGVGGNPVDSVSTNNTTASATQIQAGSITPTAANALVVAFAAINGSSIALDSGFTFEAQDNGSGNYAGGMGVLVQTTAVAVNPKWTWTGAGEAVAYNVPLLNKLPACTGSSPNLISPDWFDVSTCYGVAINGDTITVTAGSYTASASTTTSGKYVKIKAAGGGVTITDNTCSGSCSGDTQSMLILTESTAGHVEFSGFTIIQGSAQHENPSGVLFMQSANSGLPMLVHDNTYTYTVTQGDFIVAATNQGVIYSNTVTGEASTSSSCFNGAAFVRHKVSGTGMAGWQVVGKWGSDDTGGDYHLYIEGNTVVNTLEGVDSDDNSRTVVRFNNITNQDVGSHGTDTSGVLGNREMEIYGNQFIRDLTALGGACQMAQGPNTPVNMNAFVALRGGTAVVHHNVIPDPSSATWGSKSAMEFHAEQVGRDSGAYPCWGTALTPGTYPAIPHQFGWGWTSGVGFSYSVPMAYQPPSTGTQDLEPTYIWANTGSGNYASPGASGFDQTDPSSCTNGGYVPVYMATFFIQENREYYLAADVPTGKPGYTIYTCPHPLTGLAGSCDLSNPGIAGYGTGSAQHFSSQPTNTVSGQAISPFTVTVNPAAATSITVSVTSGTCTFTGTDTQTSDSMTGVATFSLTAGNVGTSCVLKAHNNTDGTIADIFSNPFNIITAGGNRSGLIFVRH